MSLYSNLLTASEDTKAEAGTEAAEVAATKPEEVDERLWVDLASMQIEADDLMVFAVCLIIALVGMVLGKLASRVVRSIADKQKQEGRWHVSMTLKALGNSFVFVGAMLGIWGALSFVPLDDQVREIGVTVSLVLLVVAFAVVAYFLADLPVHLLKQKSDMSESKLGEMIIPLFRASLRIVIVLLAVLQVIDLLIDKPITSLLAGLGIGGLAFALAAKDTLSNFFGSLVLYADRPFEIGDRLKVDGHDGPVEEVGLRSTRIRTLDGHLVTIPNGELANKTIQNIGKRPYIRRIMNVTITYDTPPDKVDEAVSIIEKLLDNHEGMDDEFPPRVFFDDLNADSLNIKVIYWYHPPKYWEFLAFNQKFNRALLRQFNEAGIEFAFPTRTLYLAGDKNRALEVLVQGGEPSVQIGAAGPE